MKNIIILIFFCSILTSCAQTEFNYNKDFKRILSKSQNPNDELFYDKLLKRFTSNDTTLSDFEVLSLMIGYTDKKDYHPYQDLDIERKIYDLNGDGKYKDALELANEFTSTHPLSVKALIEKSYSLHKLDQEDSAVLYLNQGRRIFKGMSFSGTGKTPDTPIFALGPADGQDYINKFLGADIGIMGSGIDKSNNFLDILEAKFNNGQKIKFYFIIQHAASKMFSTSDTDDNEINPTDKNAVKGAMKSLQEELKKQKNKDKE